MSQRKSLFEFVAQLWHDWGNPTVKLEKRKKKLEALKQELQLEKDIKQLEKEIERLKNGDPHS